VTHADPVEALLERWQGLAEAATAGPWTVTDHDGEPVVGPPRMTRKGDGRPKPVKGSEKPIIALGDDGSCGDPDCCGPASFCVVIEPADRAFIASAREALPRSLAANRVAVTALREVAAEVCMLTSHDTDPVCGQRCQSCIARVALSAMERALTGKE
jgi:hypothetical protein